jgi:hypothetical protein
MKKKASERKSKFVRRKDGTWGSTCHRWRIVRSTTGRYDLHDRSRSDGDQLVGMGLSTVAGCEEMARGLEWADRMEADPTGKLEGAD